jgi:hypothetical protein
MDILDFCKILNATGQPSGLDKAMINAEIQKRAEAEIREPGLSPQQLYTRYVTTTDAGRELFKAVGRAPDPRPAVQDLSNVRGPISAGESSRDLNALAQEMADKMKVSREKAYTALWVDPRRAELVARVKQEERDLQEWMRGQREPTQAAYDEYRRNWRLGRSPGSARM